MVWRFCLPHQRALWYTHVNSRSLPCASRCGDPLYHMLETRCRVLRAHPESIGQRLWVPLSRARPCVSVSYHFALALRRGCVGFVPFPEVVVFVQQT